MKAEGTKRIKVAEIVTVGDELITGQTVDTNSTNIASFLFARGYRVTRTVSVGDTQPAIQSAVKQAMKGADLVVVTGGLGPTHDDVTKKALCKLFDCSTRFDKAVLKHVEKFFMRMKRTMPEINRDYAQIPTAAVMVENRFGLAPGLFFGGKVLVLPGVPYEMESMLKTKPVDKLVGKGGADVRIKAVRTAGIGEASLASKITGLDQVVKKAKVAFLPQNGHVDIRVIVQASNKADAVARLNYAVGIIKKDIKKYIWGTDEETIGEVTGRILKRRKKTLAVAESCTGGGIGGKITDVAGSSGWFLGGVIAYSNETKIKELGVSRSLIKKYGAVSSETAIAMARGARKKFRSDYAISSTGIAGPGGGTKEKPVGLIFVAVSSANGDSCHRLDLLRDRKHNRERTAFYALWFLLEKLKAGKSD